jgi:hypothetical protein
VSQVQVLAVSQGQSLVETEICINRNANLKQNGYDNVCIYIYIILFILYIESQLKLDREWGEGRKPHRFHFDFISTSLGCYVDFP